MAAELLVDYRIEDGQKLVDQLVRDGFEVTAAFWVKTAEEGLWHLYVASPAVDAERPGEAYRIVYSSLSKIPDSSIQLSEIKLVNGTNSIALNVLAVRGSRATNLPTRYHGPRLGSMGIEEIYIYPAENPEVNHPARRYGARVYLLEDGVALVKQTIKCGTDRNSRYVVDGQREQHIDPNDDAALGATVRAALEGRL